MIKTILIGGEAGQGSAVTSHLIAKIFCSLGYYVFDYRDYQSLIRGGHNFNVLQVSDEPVFSHQNQYDIILAVDQKTIDLHKKNLKEGGLIMKSKDAKSLLENDVLIGRLFKYFGVAKEIFLEALKKEFGAKLEKIKQAVAQGYDLGGIKERLKRNGPKRYFISGNEAVALGALAAGLDVYFAYPMTPVTQVLHFLAKKQIKNNILVFQPENEIAVVNMALGASFSGAKAMVGTSGGGFALMTEALSLAGMAELPLVILLGQRTAPSSGVPTYTGQGDLKFALNAGHGEFPRIVLAPGDPKEAILRTQEAFYLSGKYRTPAIVLSDKHLAESGYTFDALKKSQLFFRQKPVIFASSYEHTANGNTTENPQWIAKMQEGRMKKAKLIETAAKNLKSAMVFGPSASQAGKGKNLIVSWGSTKGALLDALPKLKNFRFLQIIYLSPFPKEIVAREIKKSKKVVLVENNVTGSLADVISEKTGLMIKNKVLKYDGRPFTPEDIIKKIRSLK